jgi:hypothetical protein
MPIKEDRILDGVRGNLNTLLEGLIKDAVATQLGKSVSELDESDYKLQLDVAVEANMAFYDIIVKEIISEIKENAEVEIKSEDAIGLDKTDVIVTIPPGAVSQGAGAAVIINPAPIPLKGNVVLKIVSGRVKKGNIK